jgi:2-dehydro-3-deoxy-D-arabinonate dehydratase
VAGDEVTITVDQIGTLINKVSLTPEDINERMK